MDDAVFWICATLLIILCASDPDLLGAIITRVSTCS